MLELVSTFQPETRDVNEDANFNWSPFSGDKTFNRNPYRSFKPQGFGSWTEYDREMLRRTMLKHEAMFRDQVNELHRLYRIQKELMHELPTETFKSSVYRSQIHPEFDEKIWHPPAARTYWGTASGMDSRDRRPAASATQFMNGGCAKNDKLEDIKKFPKRTLDLHLPADAYIEEEDSEKTGENVANVASEAENDVKLTLGSVEVATENLNLRSGISLWAHRLADLNMPIEDSSDNGDGGSCTHKYSGVDELPEGDQQQPWTPIRSNTSSLQTNIFNEKVELRQEWRLLHNCPEQSKIAVDSFSSALFIGKYSMSTESVKLKLKNAQESQLSDQHQIETWFQEKATHSMAMFGSEASRVASSLSVVPSFSHTVGSSASWTKPTKIVNDIPVAIQALPCFGTPSMLTGQSNNYSVFKQRNGIDDDKLQSDGHKHLQTRFDDDKPLSRANGHHLQVNSLYGKSGIPEPRKCLKDLDFVDIKPAKGLSLSQGTDDESSKGLVWFRESSACNGYANNNECNSTRVDPRSSMDYSQLFTEFYGSSICSSKIPVSSSFNVKESKIQKDVIPQGLESGGTFSIIGNSRRNFNCSNAVSFDGESSADHAKGFMKGKAFRNCSSDLKKDININLNSELMPITDNKPVGVLPGVAKKQKHEIDLEAPADDLEEEDSTFSDTEAVDIDRPKIVIETSQEKAVSSEDIHLRSAADAIVLISMDAHSQSTKVTSCPSFPSSCASLHLLAEVVAQDAESCGVSKDGGLDNFESMTLKLEEIKPDKFFCSKPHQQEKPKDDMKSAASMLLSRPRRGQARKRRQKRDFQRDILPALASLSRYEVTEDLQALGGITRASKSRQSSNSTRTSTRQNKSGPQARRKRRPRSPAIIANAEVCDGPPQEQQSTHTEPENNGMNMMTWGRTTRRCPRQRVPITTGNAASAPQCA